MLKESHRATDPTVNLTCAHEAGFIAGRFVPTARAARRIYRAVAREIAPELLAAYPIVTVKDEGDHWFVSQTRRSRPNPLPPNTISVDAGGGQLYLQIDKCSGAISMAAFNK